ncbi:MAG TPA: HAMP domain-containing sensor histidine kinase [Bryobacteraceae bacterium]|jgi:signal transduction histidine kinase
MTPLREWLEPPRTLLLILFLLTLVSVSAVGWFGVRMLEQEKAVEAQRSEERLEQEADRIAATIRSNLSDAGEHLGAAEAAPDGLLLLMNEDGFTAQPSGQLLYQPDASSTPDPASANFADAELLEFAQGQPAKALEFYRRLALSKNSAVRAGALMRMARVFRNMGQMEQARAMYGEMAGISGSTVEGEPADLLAREALVELGAGGGDAIRRDLLAGRWRLTRGQFHFYWSSVAKGASPPIEAVAISDAALRVWEERDRNPNARGQETVWTGDGPADRPFLAIWRGSPEHRAVLLSRPELLLAQNCARADAVCAVVDANGRTVTGQRSRGYSAVRPASESQLPWTLYVAAAHPITESGVIVRQRFLVLGTSVMVAFLILGTYFIARAIRRETETLRMQSDFVSAVSHEFRTPLTSLRQLTEMLALGRVASDERRQLYYETLVKETTRLQRLIEGLLNFGRMEARARQYHFEDLDASALVQRVVTDWGPQVAGVGRRIELSGPPSVCRIDADPDAISVALWNLLDNALKYSPDEPAVWVECRMQDRFVAITVRDKGRGITESERKVIFRKFVRGSAAEATNAKGSGVGLAMVRYIVEAHGGGIMVESAPGEGSAFTMLLPAGGGG